MGLSILTFCRDWVSLDPVTIFTNTLICLRYAMKDELNALTHAQGQLIYIPLTL